MKRILLLAGLIAFTCTVSAAPAIPAQTLFDMMDMKPAGKYDRYALGWVMATNTSYAVFTVPKKESNNDGWYIECMRDKTGYGLYDEFKAYLRLSHSPGANLGASAMHYYSRWTKYACRDERRKYGLK